jgi:hypothetical protein
MGSTGAPQLSQLRAGRRQRTGHDSYRDCLLQDRHYALHNRDRRRYHHERTADTPREVSACCKVLSVWSWAFVRAVRAFKHSIYEFCFLVV